MLEKIAELKSTASVKQQLNLVEQIALDSLLGQKKLLELLVHRRMIQKVELSSLDGILFEVLHESAFEVIQKKLDNYFSNGIIEFQSVLKIDYQPLQQLLIDKNYIEADKLTQRYLCQLAGLDDNTKRKWLYFTDISLLPSDDLIAIDMLWRSYSRNKFGFSKQRQIWLAHNCNWEKFWTHIGWKNAGVPSRYPDEFVWNINAPSGHLPLFNQLRGVQVLSSLFNHIVWNR